MFKRLSGEGFDFEKKFVMIVCVLLIILSFYLVKDILILIVYSFIMAYFLKPFYNWFLKRHFSKGISSILAITSSVIVVVIPFVLLAYFLVLNLIQLIIQYKEYIQNPEILNATISKVIGDFVQFPLLSSADFSGIISSLVSFIISFSKSFFSSIPIAIGYFFILVFIVYYILIHENDIIKSINEYVPLDIKRQKEILDKIAKSLKVLFKGYFLTGAAQTFIALIGYIIFGADNILILTFLTLIASLIPYVGTPIVWVPVGIYMFVTGNTFGGAGIIIYGALIVSMVDNFIRPILMSDKDTLHPALVFIGFVGGMIVFGIAGIILGPLILSITSIFFRFLNEHYSKNNTSLN